MDLNDDFDDTEYLEYLRYHNLVSPNDMEEAEMEEDVASEGELPDYIIEARNDNYEGPEIIEISSDEEEEESSESDVEFLYELTAPKKRHTEKGTQAIKTFKEPSKKEYLKSFRNKVNQTIGKVDHCTECNIELVGTYSDFQLAKRSSAKLALCVGCLRLCDCIESRRERFDFIGWLITGKLPNYDNPPVFNFNGLVNRLKSRRAAMVRRLQEKGCDGKRLATTKELYDICTESNFKCIITGKSIALHSVRSRRMPYWALSFDHRIPLYDCRYDPEAWSKHNLQIMCHALNTIKGHYSDNEISRWYHAFISSKVIEL